MNPQDVTAVMPDVTNPTRFEEELTRLASAHNLRWQLKVTSLRERNFSGFNELLTLNPESVVIVSPLLMPEIEQLLYQYPRSAFITLDAFPGNENLPNLLALDFDRQLVYKELGQKIAKLIKNPDYLKSLSVSSSAPGLPSGVSQPQTAKAVPVAPKIGILAMYPTKKSREEMRSFKEGCSGTDGTVLIQEKEFAFNSSGIPDLMSVFDEMYQAGIQLYFLKMYNYTESCLEVVRIKGGQVIVEDGAQLATGESIILLSVDEDYSGSLKTALAQISSDTKGMSVKSKTLPGKFKLNWNKSAGLFIN